MNTMRLLRQLRAADTGVAVPHRRVRHLHLVERPMVLCVYHLANEPGAAIGMVYGTDPSDPHVVAVGNPLNRDLRFTALAELAHALVDYLGPVATYTFEPAGPRSSRVMPVAADTPQIVTPNTATTAWVGGVLARTIRNLRPDEQDIDPTLPPLGAHLTALAQAARSPSSSMLMSATQMLVRHWATGQLAGETENLAATLRWIAPPPGRTGRAAAAAAELATRPAGPVPDSAFDDLLYPAWDQWTAATTAGIDPRAAGAAMRHAVLDALLPAYQATFEAIALLRALSGAGSNPDRHHADRERWGRHLQRVDSPDGARFRSVLGGLAAARVLQDSEADHVAYQRQQALDDPLALEELVFTSDALHGQVVAVDADHRVGRAFAPLDSVHADVPYVNAAGTRLYSTTNARQTADVVSTDAITDIIVLELRGGMGNGRPTPDRLPAIGSTVTFIGLEPTVFRKRTLPSQLPWTHQPPDTRHDQHRGRRATA